nr:ATP dependent DNA helicase 2 subunit 2 [Hymenolepis microstoma]
MASALCIVLDIGPHMDGKPLESAKRCLTLLTQHRFFLQHKENIAVVLVGTDKTENDIADSSGNFAHISLLRPLGPYGWDLLKTLDDKIVSSNINGDVVDGIFVGVNHLIKMTKNLKGNPIRHLLILSNLRGEVNCEQIEEVIENLKEADVKIDLIGLNIQEIKHIKQEEGASEKDTQKQIATVGKLLDALKGTSFSFQEVIESEGMCFLERTASATRPWKVEMTIGGTDLHVPLKGHNILHSVRPPLLHPLLIDGSDPSLNSISDIVAVNTFHLLDEAQTEVDVDDTVLGYRYGATMVPFTKEDRDKLKLEATKCLSIIGFTKARNITPNIFVGSTVMRFVADSPSVDENSQDCKGDSSTAAVAALSQALIEMDSVALVRKVYSRVSRPTLGVLIPTFDEHGTGLIYHDLAFREDIRTFTFPSLAVVEASKEEEIDSKVDVKQSFSKMESRWRPNEEQVEAMDAFVDAMMLSENLDDSGIGDDIMSSGMSLDVEHVCNPWLHRFFTLLRKRGLGKDLSAQINSNPNDWPSLNPDDLPGLGGVLGRVEEELTSGMESTLNQVLKELNRVMPEIVPTADTAAVLQAKRANEEEDEKAANKKRRRIMAADLFGIKVEEDGCDDTNSQMEATKIANNLRIGSIDPVGDFKQMLKAGLINKACSEMETHILRLINDPNTPELFRPRAIQCLRSYRDTGLVSETSIEVPNSYNAFLIKWRQELESTQTSNNQLAFWNDVITTDTSLAPISSDNLVGMTMTPEEAKSLIIDPLKRIEDSGDKPDTAQPMACIDNLIDELE